MDSQSLADAVSALRQAVATIEAYLSEPLESAARVEWLEILQNKRTLLHHLEELTAFLALSFHADTWRADGPEPDPAPPSRVG